jgi:hypothetical protein
LLRREKHVNVSGERFWRCVSEVPDFIYFLDLVSQLTRLLKFIRYSNPYKRAFGITVIAWCLSKCVCTGGTQGKHRLTIASLGKYQMV